jgi:hypothetical protein
MADSQMRIAMLSVHSCPVGNLGTKDTGGMSVYVRELAQELGKLGVMVDVYTRVHDPRDDQIYSLGQNARLIHLKAGQDGEIDKLAVYPHLPDFADTLEDFRRKAIGWRLPSYYRRNQQGEGRAYLALWHFTGQNHGHPLRGESGVIPADG